MKGGKLTINVISESAFTVQGHGVHTAFSEMLDVLQKQPDFDVAANTFRAADIVHVHTVGPYSLLALLRARGKRIISAHVLPDSFIGSLVLASFWYPLAKWYLRFFYNRADLVLAVSDDVKKALGEQLQLKKPVAVVYNTIDTAVFQTTTAEKARAREQLNIDRPLIIGVGQVQPRKRFDIFCDVARALPESQLIWVGGMPFKHLAANAGDMQQLIDNAPANVKVTGVVDKAKVLGYYQAADIFMLPSDQETFGLVIVEAAAAGLPVVLRPLEVYQTLFGTDLPRAKTAEEFATTITKLLNDNTLYQESVQASLEMAKRYDNTVLVKRLRGLYAELGCL